MRWLVAIALVLPVAACQRAESPREEIPLAGRGVCSAEEGTVRTDGSAVELTGSMVCRVRLPREPRIRFTTAARDAAVTVSVATDGAAPRRLQIGTDPAAATELLVPLAGRPVELRFSVAGGDPVRFERLAVVGASDVEPLPSGSKKLRRRGEPATNVVLYVIDTQRADHLSLYGYDRDTSPNLVELARSGVVFHDAYATSSFTRASMPGILASRLAPSLDRQLSLATLPGPVLAEAFSRGGHRTAGFQANRLLVPAVGFDRGFDEYHVVKPDEPGRFSAAAEAVLRPAYQWLEENRDQPFFLYVQTMDAHHPYDCPPPFRGMFDADEPKLRDWRRKLVAARERSPGLAKIIPETQIDALDPRRYDECAAYGDAQLGALLRRLEELGVRERTAVVVTADHGESLGEHGRYLHGLSLAQELIRVPLLIHAPWLERRIDVERIVSLLDLPPTLLDMAGLPAVAEFEGRSLLRDRRGRPTAFGHRIELREVAGAFVRRDRWKLVETDRGTRLCDVRADPECTVDLSERLPVTTRYMQSVLDRGLTGESTGASGTVDLTEEQQAEIDRAMRALGYSTGPSEPR